ncbi:biotin-dependent carboxyltransferase family protein [Pseudoclavibacter chungangensis]|uniref:Biotin-dependent carboxyltransferase family protein n=1 Tax=Pseudoclavibacter chungangensis TaxID=587635 RepID=A0A7J5BQL5_9MICO|nr:biotin-dependent carboxyltransferase family protein [Pseudoclavibacter chungangensis]KAB1656328.1 biotin-dependent carboxyltransferase family protein [Pseudoclavibacter chungangensis]NYJ67095.1 biotin-dependent carboxylase-like uncharacterized protein [Pseudoclavibacter chungangensis]
MSGGIVVERAVVAAVTDLGRERGPAVGLPVNGALDQYSARVANILVANDERAPLVEITASDFVFVAATNLLVAVTGAPVVVVVDDVERPMWEPISLCAGQRMEIVEMAAGLRTYLSAHGAFEVPMLLGSCAPDTVAGFGTSLRPGSELVVGEAVDPVVNPFFDMSLFNLGVLVPHMGGEAVIHITDGPDVDEFAGTDARLVHDPYTVSAKSNHIGLRLTGALPVRRGGGEVLSRGVPVGAVEVPPGDELLVLHRGRGVTAGYPVLAVVTPLSLDDLGQVRPGERIRFRHTTVERAQESLHEWRDRLDDLRRRVETVYTHLGATQLVARGSTFTPSSTPSPEGIS